MKTAYVILDHAWPCRIDLSNEVIDRIARLKQHLRVIEEEVLSEPLQKKNKLPWKESINITLSYGTHKYEKKKNGALCPKRTFEGPVLSYGAKQAYGLDMRTIDEVVNIVVSSDTSWIEDSGQEGMNSTLGYGDDCTIESIPEVFFSESFLRQVSESSMFREWKYMMDHIIEDMPETHKSMFDLALAEKKIEDSESLTNLNHKGV